MRGQDKEESRLPGKRSQRMRHLIIDQKGEQFPGRFRNEGFLPNSNTSFT